jgi:hypothetical protein
MDRTLRWESRVCHLCRLKMAYANSLEKIKKLINRHLSEANQAAQCSCCKFFMLRNRKIRNGTRLCHDQVATRLTHCNPTCTPKCFSGFFARDIR